MEQRNDEAVDGGGKIRVNLKSRNSNQSAYIITSNHTVHTMDNSIKRVEERNGQSNESQSRRSLLKCYSKFKKSARPKRLMFYDNEEWTDFPESLLNLVKKDLQEQKTAIDVKLNGQHYLLDFLRMLFLDFETGLQKPIAWIDEAGKCFFPEIYTINSESHVNGQYEYRRNKEAFFVEPREIKLQIEIDVNGLVKSSEEHKERSNTLVERVQNGQRLDSNPEATRVEDNSNRQPEFTASLPILDGQEIQNESNNGELDIDDVRRMFLEGMSPFGPNLEILSVYRCSSPILQNRLELFKTQIEITRAYRGNANVQYAWLASSAQEITKINKYGLGHCGATSMNSTYSVGVHLTSASYAHISANSCEVGSNGLRHMILCRVILGSLEVIKCGSRQFHPGSLDCDTGVDDLQNPRHYIVWNFNSNTHINPEYVVTFKLTSHSMNKGFEGESEVNFDVSAAPLCSPVQGQMQAGSSISETGNGACLVHSPFRFPKTLWMPFPVLFDAISTEVPLRDVQKINEIYKLYQAKRMTHDAFIKLLRSIVGDALLKSIMSRLKAEVCFDTKLFV